MKSRPPASRALFRSFRPAAAAALLGLALLVPSLAHAAGVGVSSSPLGTHLVTGGTGAPTVYAYDTFTSPDGTNLAGRAATPTGDIWTVHNGSWNIQSARAASTTSAANAHATIEGGPGATEGKAHVTLSSIPFGGTTGVIMNYDGTNGLVIGYQRSVFIIFAIEVFEVWMYTGGTLTSIGSTAAFGSFTNFTLRGESQGNQVRVYANGTLRLTVTLTPAQQATLRDSDNTRYGLWSSGSTAVRFDDFRAESF